MTVRRALAFAAVASLVGALGVATFLDAWGHRDEAMANADAIVVLGCALQADDTPGPSLAARTRHAVDLWQQKRAPILLFSGDDSLYQPSQAEAAAHYAHRLGVPDAALLTEDASRDTWENAELSAALLKQHHLQRIILVSDPSHVWRASQHFRHFGLDVAVSGAVAADELGTSLRVWKACREVISVLRDVAFLRYWG
jgi:uncharacterized SAM-binding protein YcdF (DUF218 family)